MHHLLIPRLSRWVWLLAWALVLSRPIRVEAQPLATPHNGANRARQMSPYDAPSGTLFFPSDDGQGFDVENPKESPASGHFGLTNLKDRIEAIQGTMKITSEPSRGTTLRATIPSRSGSPRSTESQTSNYPLKPAPST